MSEVRREWIDRDYYKDLGLTQAASDEEIKTAYKKLVRKLHPDRNPGNKRAEDRFKEVSTAYEVIGDSATRRQYDQVRQAGIFGGDPSGSNSYHSFSFDAGDLLSNLFGNSRGGGFSQGGGIALRGTDYETSISIDFDEAMSGGVKNVEGLNHKTLKVTIPAGVKNNARIKIAEKGGPGSGGGPNGDLFVNVSVGKHELYERRGNDLFIEIPISFQDAVLGTNLKVPTYEGDTVSIKIPEGTSSGSKFKIAGHGVAIATTSASKNNKSQKGDLIVKVEVEVPQKLNTEQKKAVQELGELLESSK